MANPINVSEIDPIYDNKGRIKEWKVTVTFNNKDIVPPHVSGARVSGIKNADKSTLTEYCFSESVMRQGLERAWLFREAVLKQIARLDEER